MDFSDRTYLILGILLGLPMLVVALLNWVLRNRGGFARGWAGAILVGICWVVGLALILLKARGG
ncbi:MAG: hypothetical protein JSS42_03475 [Proteobacteria bacterium]|uniref:hypothetical protein n=1 Tax=Rudaea sp. TaxID=2136325 RepID=UPI00321FB350|nr:hypothetical protein [Pseudomonadota bacterium]